MDTVDPTQPNDTKITQLHPDGSRPGEIGIAAIRGAIACGAHDRAIKNTPEPRWTKAARKLLFLIALGALLFAFSVFSWLRMLDIQAGLGQLPLDTSGSQIDELIQSIARRSSLWFYASVAFFLCGLTLSAISVTVFLQQGARR